MVQLSACSGQFWRKLWGRRSYFLLSSSSFLFFCSIFHLQLLVSRFRWYSHFILTSPECLCLENTVINSPKFSPPADDVENKEACAQLAISNGSPFWTFNLRTNRCSFKVTFDTNPNGNFWSGNSDASCDFSTACAGNGSEFSWLLLAPTGALYMMMPYFRSSTHFLRFWVFMSVTVNKTSISFGKL